MADSAPTLEQIMDMKAHISDNAQPAIIAICTVSLFLGYVAVGLRLLARWRSHTRLSWDDYLVLVGLIFVTGAHVTVAHMVMYGFGRHLLLVTDREGLIASVIAAQALYAVALLPIKLSILCLYHRIFPSKTLYRSSIALGLFIVAYLIVQIVCVIVQCLPISNFVHGGPTTCIDFDRVLLVTSILNVVTDVLLLTMPIPLIWTLNLRRSKRIQLVATFAAGGVVTGISIARAVLVSQPPTPDKSWFDVVPAIMSVVELSTGLLSACLPIYRPLLRSRKANAQTTSQYYGGYGGSNSTGNRYPKNVSHSASGTDPGRERWMPLENMDPHQPMGGDRSSSELKGNDWPLPSPTRSPVNRYDHRYDHRPTQHAPARDPNPRDPHGIFVRTDVQVRNSDSYRHHM